MDEARARRFDLLERLNAYDSGPHEDERRAVSDSERCTNLLIEANKWPSRRYLSRIVPGVCGR